MKRKSRLRTYLITMTVFISGTFAIMFIVRSFLMLLAAANNLVIPLIIFSLLEVIPCGVFIYYVRPPDSALRLFTTATITTATTTKGQGSSLYASLRLLFVVSFDNQEQDIYKSNRFEVDVQHLQEWHWHLQQHGYHAAAVFSVSSDGD